MPDVDTEGMEQGNLDTSQFDHGNMPTGNMPSQFQSGSTKDVPPSVAKHDNVIKSQSH